VSRRHRHSRAEVRYQFVRVALARRRRYLALNPDRWEDGVERDLSLGRFDNEQPYTGCHRARCGLCHPDKRWHRGADRLAEEIAWRRDWGTELD
jgi:hypothetical protein